MFEFRQNNITILSPFEIYDLMFLKVQKQVGCHTTLTFSAKVLHQKNIMKHINLNSSVKIFVSEKIVFNGIISAVKQSVELNSFKIDLTANGYSSLMDIKKRKRSFQDKENMYDNIFNQIICKEYGGLFKNNIDIEKKQEKMYIQYLETDWSFLKRLASYMCTQIITNDSYAHPSIYLGNLKRKLYSLTNKSKISRIKSFLNSYYQNGELLKVESDLILDLSDGILIDNIDWWVIEVILVFELGATKATYVLTNEETFSNHNTIYNNKLAGMSLSGKIINVTEDRLKLHLDIDEEQEVSDAKLQPFSTAYSAENSAGWYVMPQVGDHAMLYFPDYVEDNAFVKNIYRALDGENKRHTNPNVKYWGTYDEKELKMDNNSVKISANEDHIYTKLNSDSGIETYSIHDIKISTGNDLYLIGNKISVKAQKGDLEILNGNSKIKMEKNTTFKSTIIKEQG